MYPRILEHILKLEGGRLIRSKFKEKVVRVKKSKLMSTEITENASGTANREKKFCQFILTIDSSV